MIKDYSPWDGSRPPTKAEFLAEAAKKQDESYLLAREARDYIFRAMGYDAQLAWDCSSSKLGHYQQHGNGSDGNETFIPYNSWQDA